MRKQARLNNVVLRSLLERLETRTLMCGSHQTSGMAEWDKAVAGSDDGHISLEQFHEIFPAVTSDPYAMSTFNPLDSLDPSDWLYDPHLLRDTRFETSPENFPNLFPTQDGVPASKGEAVASPDAVALPDIVPVKSGSSFNPYIDTTEQPGRVLIRFTTAVGNQGQGPAILTSSNNDSNPDGTQNVHQQLYTYNSSTNSFSFNSSRDAGHFVWHPGHSHFHLEDYAKYELVQNNGGTPGAQVFRNDGTAAVGDKVGFCLVNISSSFTTTSGTSSSQLPGYSASQISTGCGFTQGIHVGRADVYDSQYDGQWIDVTGVTPGNYFVKITLDGSNAIQESDETNNVYLMPVTITNSTGTGGITPDRFENIGTGVPNNTLETATELGALGVASQQGLTLHAGVDQDWFKFTATSSQVGTVVLSYSNRDVNFYLRDAAGLELGRGTSPVAGTTANPVNETISYNFVKDATYYIQAKGFSGSDLNQTGDFGGLSNNYLLRWNIAPTVTPTLPSATATASNPGIFRITRNGPTETPVVVNYSVGGTAVAGVDYDAIGSSTILSTTEAYKDITVTPRAGVTISENKTVTLTITPNFAYAIEGGMQTITLLENVKPAILSTAVTNENEVAVSFVLSEALDVASLSASDLRLTRVGDGTQLTPDRVSFDAATRTLRFAFSGRLPDGKYTANLDAANVTDAAGNPLAAAGTATVYALAGDANSDRTVNFLDLTPLAAHFNQSGFGLSGGNFDYSSGGTVNFSDLVLIAGNYNKHLNDDGTITTVAGRSFNTDWNRLNGSSGLIRTTTRNTFSSSPIGTRGSQSDDSSPVSVLA